jgi:hypothetical protein
VNPLDIVMLSDIADHMKVSKGAVSRWMLDDTFPEPVVYIRAGAVYDLSQVKTWRRKKLATRHDNRAHFKAVGL